MRQRASVVLSPHLDDAVLSQGATIASRARAPWHALVTVCTAFAGLPAERWIEDDGTVAHVTPFDKGCGFPTSVAAVVGRRHEDTEACRALGRHVTPIHAGFLDGQYDDVNGVPLEKLVAWCSRWMRGFDEVMVPLGLVHPDHVRLSLACRLALTAMRDNRPDRIVLYAEQPSATLWPDEVGGALMTWKAQGWSSFEVMLDTAEQRDELAKHDAVNCYASQVDLPELAWENVRKEQSWVTTFVG